MALERLPEWVNADAALVRRSRYLSTILLVEVGDTAWPARLKLALERIRREDLNGLPATPASHWRGA